MATSGTITVSEKGVELAYLDSGVPASSTTYVTLFTVHGTTWGYHIYDKIIDIAPKFNMRVVAISRRNYFGTTPYAADDISNLATNSDEQKAEFLQARGSEVAVFIDKFIQQHNLPPITTTADGTVQGGIALLGWSLGCTVALSAVSHVASYPESVQSCLASYLRKLILHDPVEVSLGEPLPTKGYKPHLDQNLSPEQAVDLSMRYLSAYFQHGDLSTRSTDAIEYVVPAMFHAPSIYSTPADIMSMENSTPDMMWFFTCGAAFSASYKRACYDKDVRAKFPHMQIWVVIGEATLHFSITAAWVMERHDAAAGGGFLKYKWVPKANHFVHWDAPKVMMQVLHEVTQA